MSYVPYVTEEEYEDLLPDGPEVTEEELRQASRHIDTLTYNRIVAQGFDNLTQFQQEIIRESTAKLAAFEHENADLISSVLASYSINGVSMQFGNSWNVYVQNGVAVRKDLYAFLCQTGLCCRLLR